MLRESLSTRSLSTQITFYAYFFIKKILENGLDSVIEASFQSIDLDKIKSTAYLRDPIEFSSEGVFYEH